ncbi:MAG TPA: SprB repeat-containing protein, partial [Bacteroidia bacterium]|nr:SprB repeat-containing protein [Bacteroidia bacterium]
MKKSKKPFLILFFLGLSILGMAQVPKEYYYFGGDTLKGFDVKACYESVLDDHLTKERYASYLKDREQKFVEKKYHLPSSDKSFPVGGYVLTSACNNVGFENGDLSGWTGYTGNNGNSRGALTLVNNGLTPMGLNTAETSCTMFSLETAAGGTDPWGSFPMLDNLPTGGAYSLRLGGENTNYNNGTCPLAGGNGSSPGEVIQQTFIVTKSNALFSYDYAVVLEQGTGHDSTQCPYFRAEVLDSAHNPIPCLQYYVESVSSGTPPGMSVSPNQFGAVFGIGGTPVFYSAWKTNTMNLKSYIGHPVTVRFTTTGCIPGGHFGYAYVDATCSPIELISSSPEVCAGNSITLTAPGAGATGTYSWTTKPPGGSGIVGSTTGQVVTINASGTYEVVVTQAPGCFYTIDTTVTFYPNPTVTIASTNASCSPGHDGTATVTETGGAAPITYSWSPGTPTGQGTASITGLGAGTYTCTVTSLGGCSTFTSTTITQPPGAPAISLTSTNATCSPGADGTATANVTGGNPPYTYSWSPGAPTGQGTTAITGLNGGTYTLTVTTSSTTCPATATVVVTQPNGPAATSTTTNVSCFGASDGTATVTATGGSAP